MAKSRDQASNLCVIKTFASFVQVKDPLPCFKQSPSHFTAILES